MIDHEGQVPVACNSWRWDPSQAHLDVMVKGEQKKQERDLERSHIFAVPAPADVVNNGDYLFEPPHAVANTAIPLQR